MKTPTATAKANKKTPGDLTQGEVCFIISELKRLYPDADCALRYNGQPWKLLVMGILSAQCTDKRVNIIAEDLFSVCATPECIATLPLPELERLIKSCGLYRTKAKNIQATCLMLTKDFGGSVPDTMENLLLFPGVGRKIANLILGDIYGIPAIVSDTHCIRIASRLGLTREGEKNPLITERTLTRFIPQGEQTDFCHRIVLFGREVCSARKPTCELCSLNTVCRFFKSGSENNALANR